jgi:hypothetical protein
VIIALCVGLGSLATYLTVYAVTGLVTGRTVAMMGKLRSRREIPLSGDPARWFSVFQMIFAVGLLMVVIAFATAEEEAALLRLKHAGAVMLLSLVGMLWIVWPAL